MSIYTCNICKVQYSHDKAYRHFLDCSWNQVKEQRARVHSHIDTSKYLAGYGLRTANQPGQPEVQRG